MTEAHWSSRQRIFMQRVRVLQDTFEIPWEDAVRIAHTLARLVREWEQRRFFNGGSSGPLVR